MTSSQLHRSRDGLCSSLDPTVIHLWESICDRQSAEQVTATDRLRALGVKLEHPDDGWVNREQNYIRPCYPRFNLRPDEGALGWPWRGYRLVRCTHVEHGGVLIPTTTYFFEDSGERLAGHDH